MKQTKKMLLAGLMAVSMSGSLLCGITAEAQTQLAITRQEAVANASAHAMDKSYSPDQINWCAAFVSDVLGYQDGNRTSVTSIVKDCIADNPNALGTFRRVTEDSRPLVILKKKSDEQIEREHNQLGDNYVSDFTLDGTPLTNNSCYAPNYVPQVGDLVVYDKDSWNTLEQKKAMMKTYEEENYRWDDYQQEQYKDLEHIGIVVNVYSNGNYDVVEGNYKKFLASNNPAQYGRDVLTYCSLNSSLPYPYHVMAHQVQKCFVYGFITPNYNQRKTDIKGDVNNDGEVDICDIANLKQYVMNSIGDDAINTKNADMNGNGYVDLTDLTTLSQYLLDKH